MDGTDINLHRVTFRYSFYLSSSGGCQMKSDSGSGKMWMLDIHLWKSLIWSFCYSHFSRVPHNILLSPYRHPNIRCYFLNENTVHKVKIFSIPVEKGKSMNKVEVFGKLNISIISSPPHPTKCGRTERIWLKSRSFTITKQNRQTSERQFSMHSMLSEFLLAFSLPANVDPLLPFSAHSFPHDSPGYKWHNAISFPNNCFIWVYICIIYRLGNKGIAKVTTGR